MTPAELENAIKGLVVAEFGKDVSVTAFPDNIEGYKMLGNAEILLGYRGGTFEVPQHGTLAQMRSIVFELVVISRSMSGHFCAVEILNRLRLSLQGVKIPGIMMPVRIQRDTYLGRSVGQWWYSLEILLAGVPAFAKVKPEPEIRISRITVKSDVENIELPKDEEV